MAEIRIRRVVQHIPEHLEDRSLSFNRVHYGFILPLRTPFWPRCAHPGFLVPEEGRAEHLPARIPERLLEVMEPVDVAEEVEVRLGLGEAEGLGSEHLHDLEEVRGGVFVAVTARSETAGVPELICVHAVRRVGEDAVELLRVRADHPVEGVSIEHLVEVGGEGPADRGP